MKMFSLANKIIEFGFYALFLLTPLVFFSQTSELFEFNKLVFVYAMTVIICGAWLIKMLSERRVMFRRTPFDLPILLYFLSRVISTFLSIDIHTSVFGYYSRFHEGLLATISYILLYYALVSNFDKEKVIRLLKFGLIGGAITAFWAFLEHFGHSPSCLLITGQFNADCWVQDVRSQVFATLGQPNWLGAYLCVLIPITMGLWWQNQKSKIKNQIQVQNSKTNYEKSEKKSLRFDLGFDICVLSFALLFYVVILFTQSRSAFIGFWFSAPLLLWFLREGKKKISIIFITIIIFITFIIGTRTPIAEKLTLPYYLNQRVAALPTKSVAPLNFGISSSTEIRKVVWTGALKVWQRYPVFGSGVETFAYSYYAGRPATHNLLSEWDFLYNKAHNEYLNVLATTGMVGLLCYLFFILMVVKFLIFNFKFLIKSQIPNPKSQISTNIQSTKTKTTNNHRLEFGNWDLFGTWCLGIGIFVSWLSILITNFFGFSVVVVALYFFLLPAIMVILHETCNMKHETNDEDFDDLNYQSSVSRAICNISPATPPRSRFATPRRCYSLGVYLACFAILFSILYSIFYILRYWRADLSYAAADRLVRAGYPTEARTMIEQSIKLNPLEPIYWDEAGTVYSTLVMSDLTDKEKMAFAEAAEKFSERATSVSPRNLTFWKSKARIFYALMKFDEKKYLPLALKAMEKAHELAPTDAKVAYNLAILYGQTGDIQKAVAQLQETIGLKINYRDAYYALGLYLREAGEQLEDKELKQHAISTLKFSLENIEPNDPEIIKKLEEWQKN